MWNGKNSVARQVVRNVRVRGALGNHRSFRRQCSIRLVGFTSRRPIFSRHARRPDAHNAGLSFASLLRVAACSSGLPGLSSFIDESSLAAE